MNLLIRNATIATSTSVFPGDLLVEGETIKAIGKDLPAGDARVIDASGKYLLPGGIDVHTHFDLDLGSTRASDDFHSGTVAAAFGGTTSVVDHLAFGPDGCKLEHMIDVYHGLAKDAVIDYGFHGVIQHVDDAVLADMEKLLSRGVTSYKIYLTYGHKIDDPDAIRVLARARELGVIICVHCESDAGIAYLADRLEAEGKGAPRFHPVSRPPAVEAEAVFRMLMLAKTVGDAPLYVVHLSTGLGLDAIRLARRYGQTNVYAETCPQYLFLNDSRYDDDREGLKYIMSPPLRKNSDREAMWRGLRDGDIDVIATDHCPFFFETQKQAGAGNFRKCPGGAPGVEARLPLLFSEGFMRGRLSLPEVVRLCSTRPAEIFGFGGKKGDLAPGRDADLVLFDPAVRRTLSKVDLHERTDYTPYEGMPLQGVPVMTIARGEVIVENGEFKGKTGRGKYIHRTL